MKKGPPKEQQKNELHRVGFLAGLIYLVFTPAELLPILATLPPASRWWVAYSGGLDSHCLLHALANLAPYRLRLAAVYVDHGLNPASSEWGRHGARICEALGVPYRVIPVQAAPQPGESPEAAARTARYGALAGVMAAGDGLFTAHHQNDQAETLLLQLLRGAGPRGLAAMPWLAPFPPGWLARPLLQVNRQALRGYGQSQGLVWVEDDSNGREDYRRNYLRQQILPRLTARWPGATATLARAAIHQGETADLLLTLGRMDLGAAARGNVLTLSSNLIELPTSRLRNGLRSWIQDCGFLPPSSHVLEQLVTQVLPARWDATPCLSWPGAELRRYRDRLFLLSPLRPLPALTWEVSWDFTEPLVLPWGGKLIAESISGDALLQSGEIAATGEGVTVRRRRGGEICRAPGRTHHHPLKDWWQQAGIPPWERERTPLLYQGGELVAVPGLCQSYSPPPGETMWRIQWQR